MQSLVQRAGACSASLALVGSRHQSCTASDIASVRAVDGSAAPRTLQPSLSGQSAAYDLRLAFAACAADPHV